MEVVLLLRIVKRIPLSVCAIVNDISRCMHAHMCATSSNKAQEDKFNGYYAIASITILRIYKKN